MASPPYPPVPLEDFYAICDNIADGAKTVNEACQAVGVKPRVLRVWLRKNPEYLAVMKEAKEDRAESRFDQMQEVIRMLRSGELSPAQAKTELLSLQWMCAKENKEYNDKQILEHSGLTKIEVLHAITSAPNTKADNAANPSIQAAPASSDIA